MAVGPSFAADGKSTVAVTHLALARSQNSGNGTLGIFIHRASQGSFFCAKIFGETIALWTDEFCFFLLSLVFCVFLSS